jgi:hypothetical protein
MMSVGRGKVVMGMLEQMMDPDSWALQCQEMQDDGGAALQCKKSPN